MLTLRPCPSSWAQAGAVPPPRKLMSARMGSSQRGWWEGRLRRGQACRWVKKALVCLSGAFPVGFSRANQRRFRPTSSSRGHLGWGGFGREWAGISLPWVCCRETLISQSCRHSGCYDRLCAAYSAFTLAVFLEEAYSGWGHTPLDLMRSAFSSCLDPQPSVLHVPHQND